MPSAWYTHHKSVCMLFWCTGKLNSLQQQLLTNPSKRGLLYWLVIINNSLHCGPETSRYFSTSHLPQVFHFSVIVTIPCPSFILPVAVAPQTELFIDICAWQLENGRHPWTMYEIPYPPTTYNIPFTTYGSTITTSFLITWTLLFIHRHLRSDC